MKIVMIHCWPYLREAGWLAKFHSNVYIDTCWQPVLNPAFFREALATWWNYVPLHKITCGHDSTTVEMACGSALFTREILAESLSERKLNMSRFIVSASTFRYPDAIRPVTWRGRWRFRTLAPPFLSAGLSNCTTERSFSVVSFKRKHALLCFVPVSILVLPLARSCAYSIRMPANPLFSSTATTRASGSRYETPLASRQIKRVGIGLQVALQAISRAGSG
jgi:hypothetical protein